MTARTLRLLCLAALLPCFAAYLAAQSTSEDRWAHIKLEPTSRAYKLGQPIVINIVLFNPTEHDLRFGWVGSPDQGDGYNFVVSGVQTSALLERTEIGKRVSCERDGSFCLPQTGPSAVVAVLGGGNAILPAHQSKTFTTDLSRNFKFTEPGAYRVEIKAAPSETPAAPITIVVTR